MGKVETLLKKYMPAIKSGCPYGVFWSWENADEKWIDRINNALFSYAIGVMPSEVIAVIDVSFMGNGKKGYLFTQDALYSSELGGFTSVEYNEIKRLGYARREKRKENDQGIYIETKNGKVGSRGYTPFRPNPFLRFIYEMIKFTGGDAEVLEEGIKKFKE